MRRCFLYLIIIGTCLFLSCNWLKKGSGALPIELVQAENIMYENPDSALHILQGMKIPVEGEAHATWALLLTQAKYKCFVEQSDSLVNIAYDYFVKKSNSERKALALYIKGGLLYDKNQYEKALNFYLDAEKEIEITSNDTLAFLIDSHICMIYAYQSLYDYAIEYGWKANEYAVKTQNIDYLILSYIRLARANGNVNLDESIKCYEKAISIADNNGSLDLKATALVEVAGRYNDSRKKDYKKSLFAIKEAIKIRETAQTYVVLGDLFRKMNNIDSAYYYLQKAAITKNIYTSRTAYQSLYYMSEKIGNYKEAVKYSGKMWELQDSINRIARNKALIEMQEKYNQQKVINEKDKAEKRGLIILCVSIGAISIIVSWYQWKVLQKNKELEDKRKELDSLNEQLTKNQETIAQNEKRIDMVANQKVKEATEELHEKEMAIQNMKKQNKDLEKENQGLQKRIEQHESALQEKTKDTTRLNLLIEQNQYLHVRENFLVNQLLKTNELVCRLKREPDGLKNNKEWKELIEMTNLVYNGYTERLLEKVPTLTENDIRICCLIKLSFSNVDMADILGISSTSVSRQKLRLKERIVQQIGSLGENVLLDIWLKEF